MERLRPLLQRKIPNHLEELRIENCKMGEEITRGLLTTLLERCYITKLGLVNVNLNEETF